MGQACGERFDALPGQHRAHRLDGAGDRDGHFAAQAPPGRSMPIRAAFTFRVSWPVSIRRKSTPPSIRASACSSKCSRHLGRR